MALHDELNEIKPQIYPKQGKVLLKDDNGEDLDFEGEGYIDAHPEGADRGGYQSYWKRGDELAVFDDQDWCWFKVS